MLDQMSDGRFLLRRRARHLADRGRVLRRRFRDRRGAVPRSLRGHPHRPDRGRADLSRQVLRFRPCADRHEAGAEALSRAVVRHSRPDSIPWAAERGAHIVTLRDTAAARAIIDALPSRNGPSSGRAEADLPMMGINRHIVVAETEAAAREIARRGYPRVAAEHGACCGRPYNVPFPLRPRCPRNGTRCQAHGHAIAGTPAQVRDYIAARDRGDRRQPISSAISRSARSATTRRCARSNCSPRRSCRRLRSFR